MNNNTEFTWETIIRVAFRAYLGKIHLPSEDRFVYLVKYIYENYWSNDIVELDRNNTILKILYRPWSMLPNQPPD